MSERCDTCRFWKYTHQQTMLEREHPTYGWSVPFGRCRRFPSAGFYSCDDWCGEYVEAREPHRHE